MPKSLGSSRSNFFFCEGRTDCSDLQVGHLVIQVPHLGEAGCFSVSRDITDPGRLGVIFMHDGSSLSLISKTDARSLTLREYPFLGCFPLSGDVLTG